MNMGSLPVRSHTRFIVIVVFAGALLFGVWRIRNHQSVLSAQDVTSRLSHLMLLPQETPVVATVMNAHLLQSQSSFYAHAIDGDILVLFPKAARAFLYRPSANIIVNVGPLSVQPTTSPSSSPVPSPSIPAKMITIEVRNGTNEKGIAKSVGESLKTKGYDVTKETSATNTYPQTLVVVSDGNVDPVFVQKLTQVVGGSVSSLPKGELTSTAQVLVLIGK